MSTVSRFQILNSAGLELQFHLKCSKMVQSSELQHGFGCVSHWFQFQLCLNFAVRADPFSVACHYSATFCVLTCRLLDRCLMHLIPQYCEAEDGGTTSQKTPSPLASNSIYCRGEGKSESRRKSKQKQFPVKTSGKQYQSLQLTSYARVLEKVKLAPVDCFNSITKPCILAQSKI